ncbi:MAG: hypothetical protein K6F99_00455 [Lachnospiraceae bacterium]|nr:hypothetical protein [Lachnospiraceae bacterium]
MPIGKDSIKRAAGITEEVKSESAPAEVKSAVIAAPAKSVAPAKKAPAKKAPAKKAAAKKAAAKKPVKAAAEVKAAPSAKKEASGLTTDQATGINAHYDINNPLPTFLL